MTGGDDTAGYNVYRRLGADGTFTKLNGATLTGTTYSDDAAPTGRSFYQVRTVDTSGNTSAPVAADAVRTVPIPAQVTGLQATGSQTGIALTWTASNATGLTGYNVYRSTTATGTYTKLTTNPVTPASYNDTTAPAGATSYYQVTAVNATGESVRARSPPMLPGRCRRRRRSPACRPPGRRAGIALTWTASSATGLTGYNVYRSTTATGTYTKLTTNAGDHRVVQRHHRTRGSDVVLPGDRGQRRPASRSGRPRPTRPDLPRLRCRVR